MQELPDGRAEDGGELGGVDSVEVDLRRRVLLGHPPQVFGHSLGIADIADYPAESGHEVHDVSLEVLVDSKLAMTFILVLPEGPLDVRLRLEQHDEDPDPDLHP